MAAGTGIQIEARAQAIGHRLHLIERWNAVIGEEILLASHHPSYYCARTRRAWANAWIHLSVQHNGGAGRRKH